MIVPIFKPCATKNDFQEFYYYANKYNNHWVKNYELLEFREYKKTIQADRPGLVVGFFTWRDRHEGSAELRRKYVHDIKSIVTAYNIQHVEMFMYTTYKFLNWSHYIVVIFQEDGNYLNAVLDDTFSEWFQLL